MEFVFCLENCTTEKRAYFLPFLLSSCHKPEASQEQQGRSFRLPARQGPSFPAGVRPQAAPSPPAVPPLRSQAHTAVSWVPATEHPQELGNR